MTNGNARQTTRLLALQGRLEAASARLGHQRPVIAMQSKLDEETGIDFKLVRHARNLLRMRASLAEHFDGELFADPALDMILDLFVAHYAGARLAVSSVAVAGGTSPTTGLRYIAKLEACGYVERFEDQHDKRRQWVAPTEACLASTRAWLRADLDALAFQADG